MYPYHTATFLVWGNQKSSGMTRKGKYTIRVVYHCALILLTPPQVVELVVTYTHKLCQVVTSHPT